MILLRVNKFYGFYKLFKLKQIYQRVKNVENLKNILINRKAISFSLSKNINNFKVFKSRKLQNNLWCWDIISGLLIWFGLIDDYENRENPLILTIKRGILCQQRNELSKAEIILHSALSMAQELNNSLAETYIFDLLANNAFLTEDFKTAEKLFVEVLKRIISEGVEENSEPVIEISIKLATIYSKNRDFERCNQGFSFCLNEQKDRIKSLINKNLDELSDEEINSLALWGMCLDYYAKHLSFIGNFDKAIDSYKNAISVSQKINGDSHPQTLVLMNDLADTLVNNNQSDSALIYLNKAVEEGLKTDSEDLPVFYHNIGSIYLEQSNRDSAELSCRESLKFSLKLKDRVTEKKARECLIKAIN